MTTTATEYEHDVFISYAREDGQWVIENLYEPLLRCRTPTGERPRVFLDLGMEPGLDWTEALSEAIEKARVFVPVYSSTYFSKRMCRWELTQAWIQDRKMSPVLIDLGAEESVPAKVANINYVYVGRDDWFPMICRSAGLEPEQTPVELEFLDQPTDTFVNHTLAPVRVRVSAGGEPAPHEEEVTLSAEGAELSGTVSALTEGGVAEFRDLSLPNELERTRLVATAKGCEPAFSDSFAVHRQPAERVGEPAIAVANAEAALFFEDGGALAVLVPGRLAVYDLDGRELGGVELGGRVRVIRSSGAALAVAEWTGDVHLAFADGRTAMWRFRTDGRLTVPGDLAVRDDHAYVGFWDGAVHRLVPGEDAQHELQHDAGVQALAALDEALWVCGLDGALCRYRDGKVVESHALERAIHLLNAYGDCLVAVGDRRLYQVLLATSAVYDEPLTELQLERPAGVFAGTDLPVVIDARGKGIRFDRELDPRRSFHTVAGAVPVSADRGGRYCAFRNPDGSLSLMVEDRVALTHPGGVLAVSPDGDRVALGDADGIKLLDAAALEQLVAA
jgi:hypothetical protein